MFDKDLTWKNHIDNVCGKITKFVGGLALLRHRTNIAVLREVFFALNNSYARYRILLWGNASVTTLHLFKVLLNKAIRIITFAPYGPLDLQPIYQELEILNRKYTFLFERGKFTYEKRRNLLPTDIANYFNVYTSHNYNLRWRENNASSFHSNTATLGANLSKKKVNCFGMN